MESGFLEVCSVGVVLPTFPLWRNPLALVKHELLEIEAALNVTKLTTSGETGSKTDQKLMKLVESPGDNRFDLTKVALKISHGRWVTATPSAQVNHLLHRCSVRRQKRLGRSPQSPRSQARRCLQCFVIGAESQQMSQQTPWPLPNL